MSGIIGVIVDTIKVYKHYFNTVSELSNLSDEHLKDLGITRSQIHHVALTTAYKAK